MNTIPELEEWFDSHQLTWRAEIVPVDEIDQVTGLSNQARLEPLDEDTVERYAADMTDGAMFPPIVLTTDFAPVGGNHRVAAARRAGRSHLDAYIVDGLTPHLEWLLALEDNRRHGLPLTDAERLSHAVRLVHSGEAMSAAAKVCGLTTAKLQRHLDAVRADQRAQTAGLLGDGWLDLSPSARARLVSIRSDKVFAKTARLAIDGAIRAGEIGDLVGRLNAADTPAEAMQFLVTIEEQALLRTARTGHRPPSAARVPRQRLLQDLGAILKFDPDKVAADTSSEDLRVLNQIQSTVAHLTRISAAIAAHQQGAA